MDWNRTKTIFIFTFLILNIYLGYQIFKTHQEDQYSLFVESSVEEQLTSEGIEYKHLPVDVKEASSLNAKSKLFKDEDLKKLKEQKAALLEEKTIRSVLDKPFSVSEKSPEAKLSQFLKRYVISGKDYELWNVNKEKKTVTFFQKYKKHKIFDNENGMIVAHLNDKGEIISYEQTMLGSVKTLDDEQDVLTPLKALENLFLKDELKKKDKVTDVEFGYYTFDLPLLNSQVLAPTWHIVVNEDTSYFVNAFEGQIIKKGNK